MSIIYNQSDSDSSTNSGFCILRSKDDPICDCDKSSDSNTTTTSSMGRQFSDAVHYTSIVSPYPRSDATTMLCEDDYDLYDYRRLFDKYFPHGRAISPYGTTSSRTTTSVCEDEAVQRTFAIVKPHAMIYEDVVLRAIDEAGLAIVHKRYVHLTPEQVSEIYARHYGNANFPHVVVSTSIGPILVLALSGVDAIAKWKRMIGGDESIRAEWFYPISMRKRFGLRDKGIPEALHASQTRRDAILENRYFFPESVLEPITCDRDKVEDYLSMFVNPTLMKSLIELVKVKPCDPILFLGQSLLLSDPYQPKFAPKVAMLPT